LDSFRGGSVGPHRGFGGSMTTEIGSAVVPGIGLIFGLIIGSFLNVVIHRVPLGLSVVSPRSRCPTCKEQISGWDNIPIISYLILRGHCRRCEASISMRYPAVEFLTGLLFMAIAWRFGMTWWTPIYCLFAAGLVAAALIDFEVQIIPDGISLGGLVLAMGVIPVLHISEGIPIVAAFRESAVGALVGAGVLWAVAFIHARISVALGREFDHWPGQGESLPRPTEADYWLWFPGLGLGDIKLLGMIGAVVGAAGVLNVILAACLIGLILGGAQALSRGALGAPFGFAPSIALAALVSLFLPPLWLLGLLSG
ncbi:MAG: prepilin peptidase, partial [Myxococcota bacterium]